MAKPTLVPIATPSQPSRGRGPSPRISDQLSAMLVTLISTIATRPVIVSPAPCRQAMSTASSMISGSIGSRNRKYRVTSSATSPSAPSTPTNRGPRAIITSVAITASTMPTSSD